MRSARHAVRPSRRFSFTAEGERLFRSANSAIGQLQDTLGTIAAERGRGPVTITASIGVTGLWILPRLGRFQQLHPAIDLRVAANNRVVDLAGERIDLAVRYGPLAAMDEGAIPLFGETVAPVAHPSLGLARLASANDIAGQVLLEFDDPGRPWLHWKDWLASAGWNGARPKGILRFNQYDQVIQSALAGQGIALGRIELIQPMLDDGRLRRVPTSHPGCANEHTYWLVRADAAPRPEVAAVIDWIVAEARSQACMRPGHA